MSKKPWVYRIARLKTTCMFRFDSIRKTRSEQVEVIYIQNTVIHRIENGCTKQNWMTIVLVDARLLCCTASTSIHHIAAASNATAAGLWHKQPEKRIQNNLIFRFLCGFLRKKSFTLQIYCEIETYLEYFSFNVCMDWNR